VAPVAVTPRRRLGRIASAFNVKGRRLGVPGTVTAEMLARMPQSCHYCGISLGIMDGTWDHSIAFDKGGDNMLSNIVRCCTTCNRRKFSKSPEEFVTHDKTTAVCALPGCGNEWQPRYAEYKRGMARYCSRSCSAKSRWVR
jgi:hypothetical protein